MVCATTKFIKFRKRRKKSFWMMLDEVCSRTKFHPTCFDAKIWIFHVGLVWCGVSSNIHKFSLISNVCRFELFSNFEFRFNHKHLLWMYYIYYMSYSRITRLCIFNKVSNNISIANLQLLRSWNSLWNCLSNCFSRNRWNLKRIEWIRGNIIPPFAF